ncbi:SusC/RagA family TonB-linked outer membrane protein [Pseudarcicella hirudinis]|uniref:SusC/RagA family TonB-linked outer membrane protein n=1 Tax=Pseudarcicella hirudinis TaxID=1079859 RepID=UPI0035E9219C
MGEVVVTGYGSSSKKTITGSVSSITAANFNVGAIASPGQLLQGKVPGLNISRSGDPNSEPSVILRGPSTLRSGAQEPFYVIDGVPGASISLVAPADIESIDVLRDASSTAIYGSRAANGVIMITTKKSKSGESRLEYSTYAAVENVSNKINMLSGDQLRQYLKDNGQSLTAANNDAGANTNWQDEVQRTGYSQNHNLSYGGGSTNSTYGVSLNYFNNKGIIKTTSLDRMIIKAYINSRFFNDRLKLSLNVTNSNSNGNDVFQSELFGNMLTYLPTVNVFRPDGSYTEDPTRGGYLNPVSIINNNTYEKKRNDLLLSGIAEVNILKDLKYTLSISSQKNEFKENIYMNNLSNLALGLNGKAQRSVYENTQNVIESYFNYDKYIGNHTLKLLAGYSWQENRGNDGFGASTRNFYNDALSFNNLYLGNPKVLADVSFLDKSISTLRLISFYGRVNYSYDNKYLFQASLRKDGSSAFGANQRWGYFPSFSAGWRISQEDFMKNLPAISELKLRAGYGVSGNSAGFDAFTSILRYGSVGKYYSNGDVVNAIGVVQNPNEDLKWESTSTTNIGLDFSLFNSRINGTIDYYIKNTSDLIWDQYPVSTTVYFLPTITANVGKIQNKGIELTLDASVVKKSDFSWNVALNLAHNDNKVVSLSNDKFKVNSIQTAFLGGKGQSGNWSQIVQEGYPLGTFNLWHYMGKNENGVSTYQKADGTVVASQPLTSDYTIAGNAQPDLIYGLNNTFRYKNFDFNFFVRGTVGNKILNMTLAALNSPADAKNQNIPAFTLGESFKDINAYLTSDRYLENGSYLRLDNATLGYSVKTNANSIKKLRFYVSATNLFVITGYRGIDPEINIGGLTPGIDNRNFYPKTRSFLIGANILF